jgi:predicted transcriptional regulator
MGFRYARTATRYTKPSPASEAEIRSGIQTGLADMKAGRTMPHDEAMERLEAAVAAIQQNGQSGGPAAR